MKRIFSLLIFSVLILSFGCCDSIFGPAAPGKPTVTPGGESLTISWDAVKGAVEYNLYYSSDYSEPIIATASSIIGITECSYTHTDLVEYESYRYAVLAISASGLKSALSPATDPIMPNPRMQLEVVFPGYTYKEAVALILNVAYDPIGDTITGSPTIQTTLTGLTDNIGYISFNCDIDHKRFWGFTIFKDMDASGTMTTGDVVWGGGGSGVYGYKYIPYYIADSVHQLYENWETAAGGFHTY